MSEQESTCPTTASDHGLEDRKGCFCNEEAFKYSSTRQKWRWHLEESWSSEGAACFADSQVCAPGELLSPLPGAWLSGSCLSCEAPGGTTVEPWIQLPNSCRLSSPRRRQRVHLEAWKSVPGADGRPTQLPDEIEDVFPLVCPTWDCDTAAGRERLRLYRQVLLAGLKGAGRCPTNLAKVRARVQGKGKTPAGFLERLMEGYRMYTPFGPLAKDRQPDVIMSFIGQLASGICNKLQR
ncbi:uncharacterized protein [Vulpes vulpes]|uniref:Uncharacterized protein isoform X2 n=1 Tax=Vulpes vulpes TaxID=9627 RepID=A0ABM5B662_VULVU